MYAISELNKAEDKKFLKLIRLLNFPEYILGKSRKIYFIYYLNSIFGLLNI